MLLTLVRRAVVKGKWRGGRRWVEWVSRALVEML